MRSVCCLYVHLLCQFHPNVQFKSSLFHFQLGCFYFLPSTKGKKKSALLFALPQDSAHFCNKNNNSTKQQWDRAICFRFWNCYIFSWGNELFQNLLLVKYLAATEWRIANGLKAGKCKQECNCHALKPPLKKMHRIVTTAIFFIFFCTVTLHKHFSCYPRAIFILHSPHKVEKNGFCPPPELCNSAVGQ